MCMRHLLWTVLVDLRSDSAIDPKKNFAARLVDQMCSGYIRSRLACSFQSLPLHFKNSWLYTPHVIWHAALRCQVRTARLIFGLVNMQEGKWP
jgi:hypothetical protein